MNANAMKIEVLTEQIQNTRRDKKWLHELQSPMRYRIHGVGMKECDIYCDRTLIGFIRDNILEICKGYAHDGLTCFPDTKANRPAGLLHDFGYQTALWPREICDAMIKEVMRAREAKFSNIVWLGVRLFGKSHYGKQKNIIIEYL